MFDESLIAQTRFGIHARSPLPIRTHFARFFLYDTFTISVEVACLTFFYTLEAEVIRACSKINFSSSKVEYFASQSTWILWKPTFVTEINCVLCVPCSSYVSKLELISYCVHVRVWSIPVQDLQVRMPAMLCQSLVIYCTKPTLRMNFYCVHVCIYMLRNRKYLDRVRTIILFS